MVGPASVVTHAEFRSALDALEREGHFTRRKLRDMWLWRRIAVEAE